MTLLNKTEKLLIAFQENDASTGFLDAIGKYFSRPTRAKKTMDKIDKHLAENTSLCMRHTERKGGAVMLFPTFTMDKYAINTDDRVLVHTHSTLSAGKHSVWGRTTQKIIDLKENAMLIIHRSNAHDVPKFETVPLSRKEQYEFKKTYLKAKHYADQGRVKKTKTNTHLLPVFRKISHTRPA